MPNILNLKLEDGTIIGAFCPSDDKKVVATMIEDAKKKLVGKGRKVDEIGIIDVPVGVQLICRECGGTHIVDVDKLHLQSKEQSSGEKLTSLKPDAKFDERLAYYRRLSGKSTKDVASATGVIQETVNSWERGAKVPTVTTVLKIADFLDIAPNLLLPSVASSRAAAEVDTAKQESKPEKKAEPASKEKKDNASDAKEWETVFDIVGSDEEEELSIKSDNLPF